MTAVALKSLESYLNLLMTQDIYVLVEAEGEGEGGKKGGVRRRELHTDIEKVDIVGASSL